MADLCKSCFAPIVWVMTTAGKRMPLVGKAGSDEPKPFDSDGSVKGRVQEHARAVGLFDDGAPVEVTVHVLKESEDPDPGLPVWRSHFWDCPQSKEWQTRKAGR